MIIDAHTHIFPDAVAPRAMEKLTAVMAQYAGCLPEEVPVSHKGTREALCRQLETSGIDHALVLNIATSPRQESAVNDGALNLNRGNQRLKALGSIHPDSPGALEELERLNEAGVPGIKLHPDYQDFLVDDQKLYPVYELCSDLGLPIVFHAGFDPLSPDLCHCPPEKAARVIKDFPRLKIVLAHMGGMEMWEDVVQYLPASENLYMDTAMVYDCIDPVLYKKIIRTHGADQILFGSDSPWHDPLIEIQYLQSLRLKDEEEEAILGMNVERLFGPF
ncbi:MAG: amidohydrolase family protein [Spirochaetales bacterium]|nr:amidohydrolase family protein [Spirochaetales bacterium]